MVALAPDPIVSALDRVGRTIRARRRKTFAIQVVAHLLATVVVAAVGTATVVTVLRAMEVVP